MPRDISTIDPEKLSDVTQNAYYKKLQKELKDKQSAHKLDHRRAKGIETEESNTISEDPVKKASATLSIEDKVSLRSFKWTQDKKGEFELKPTQITLNAPSDIDLEHDASHILKIFGQKIDFTSKMTQLKQSFMHAAVQSRSHQFFLSKFAQFKMGLLGQLLSAIGVSPTELETLSKKAIQGAVQENIRQMAENIYNLELTELLYGNSRKAKRSLAMLRQIEKQLITQMALFGKRDYWSKPRLLEERITQCKKIEEEFQKERDDLAYSLMFGAQMG